MKIAIEANSLLENLTGVGTYTYNLIYELKKIEDKNTKYYIFFDNISDNLESIKFPFSKDEIIIGGKKRRFLFFKDKNLDRILNYFFYKKNFYNYKIDIFHGTNYIFPSIITRNNWNLKKILTVHDLSFVLYPEFFVQKANKLTKVKYYFAREADFIITDSNSSKEDIIRNWNINREKIKVIYQGVNTNYFAFNQNKDEYILKKYRINNNYILYVGTLEPRKNLCRLIEAFKIIKSKFKDIKLLLVGRKGWLYDPIFEKIDNLKLKSEVIHIGYVDIEELPHFYSNAKVFVYPSIYEGFGLPPLEAMACGCPVITSNTSSLPEVVGDAGILVNPYNIEEIADTISRVIMNENLRKEMIEKGLKQAKKFSWKKAAQETLEVYREVYNK